MSTPGIGALTKLIDGGDATQQASAAALLADQTRSHLGRDAARAAGGIGALARLASRGDSAPGVTWIGDVGWDCARLLAAGVQDARGSGTVQRCV